MPRTLERELITPALQLIALYGTKDFGLEVGELRQRLRAQITPTAEDLLVLAGRSDDRLSQVIRNLVSHRTLERRGLARYRKDATTGAAYYNLTPLGWASVDPARSGSEK